MDKIAAFQILQEIYDKSLLSERTALEYLFPELKESEDERIRKSLIHYLHGLGEFDYPDKETYNNWLAWLEKQGKPNVAQTDSHDYVEIGGVKWATMNVGANAITDYGLYFQWGDTQGYTAEQVGEKTGQKVFTWDDYKYGKYDSRYYDKGMTKYNNTDGKTVLDTEDDAVTAAWGGNWRMPTHEEFQALYEATTNQWVENYLGSGVNGILFTDKTNSSKTLFFPADGNGFGGNVWNVGRCGFYRSRSLYTDYVNDAWNLCFDDGYVSPDYSSNRNQGYSVRGVMNC